MFATVEVETEDVLTLKVAELCPVGTVTLAGVGVAAVELLDSVTTTPGSVATAFRVTVPDAVPPPITEATDRVTPLTCASAGTPAKSGASRHSVTRSEKTLLRELGNLKHFDLAILNTSDCQVNASSPLPKRRYFLNNVAAV